jgi:hypothetical protein
MGKGQNRQNYQNYRTKAPKQLQYAWIRDRVAGRDDQREAIVQGRRGAMVDLSEARQGKGENLQQLVGGDWGHDGWD